ncbi:hypothetical protein G9Q86_08435 [Pseudomonas sp. CCUG 57209]|uniref:hypothetical protein n=1 Tax=Pseudomonas sivasensis TaxID=1880678 RepID=UPI0015EC18D7|nr:hypothetical protein [Pseudomonas sivasensis]MBA2928598.1 hypothetical protein [Pseudomonas sivasensis]
MQGGEKETKKKRLIITTVTTSCLFVLPFTPIPEGMFFLMPGIAEGAAFLAILAWIEFKGRAVSKKTAATKSELLSTLDKSIDKLTGEVAAATSPAIIKVLNKELTELYKERSQDLAIHRKKLRDDIHKLEQDEKALKTESESLKDQLTQKAEEELDKIIENKDTTQTSTAPPLST